VISNNDRISVSHDETRAKFRLHITNVTLEDAGPYMCQINSMPVKLQSGYLTVFQPSDITKIMGDKVVNEGGIVRLTCEAEGYPPPSIYWTREQRDEMINVWMNGNRIQVDRVENKTLELQKVTRSQMGSYLCIATNGYPPAVSKKINLKVNFRPVITVPDLRIFIRPGEDVSLECIFEFHPRGLMWWERESGEILSRNDKYSVADYILNEFTIRSRLIIRNFEDSDVGRYTCVGRNGFNKEGDREEGHVQVNFVKVETTTLQHEDIYERHHYEYTIPEIKTIEANTINYENENFRHHTESDLDESSNRRRQQYYSKDKEKSTTQGRSSEHHYPYFNDSNSISKNSNLLATFLTLFALLFLHVLLA